jgi:integrase
MGSAYRPKLKDWRTRLASDQRSAVWWCKYYVNGWPLRESTRTDDKETAKQFLKRKEGAAASGQPILPRVDRIRYEEVAEDLRTHYKTARGDHAVPRWAKAAFVPLDGFFPSRRAATIGPAVVTEYVAWRQTEKVANATVNRELAVLWRMLRLAYEQGKLARLPVIRKLKESAPREGFFERAQYGAVRRRLKPDLQAAVAIAYRFGWRVQEILRVERRQLDLEAGTLRLDPGTTKNDEGRLVYLTPDLARLLGEQLERVRGLERKTGRIIPFLFPYLSGRRRAGQRRRDFRNAWAKACEKAGVPGKLRHDFRRTAVRNLVNAGVPEKVAMTITGHRTRSVFDRYHIVSPADLQAATRRLAEADGHVSGHVRAAALDGRPVTTENA